MKLSRSAFVAAALAALTACGGDAPADGDGRAAGSEVLEGTISDAMLPVDRVRSQAPLADPEPATRRSPGTAAPDADATSAVEGAPQAEDDARVEAPAPAAASED